MDIKNSAFSSSLGGSLFVDSTLYALENHSILSVTDLDGTIIYVNELFCKISGYSESELIGNNHNLLNSGHEPKSFWKNMFETVLSGGVWHGEVKNRAKSGSYYWVDTTIVPFYEHDKIIGFTSIRTEITKQKQIIEELSIAKKNAEIANKVKEEFLSNMSHELRTPLNGVYASLQLLNKGGLSNEFTELINNSLSSCEYLQKVINDILDFSNIESGECKIESFPFNIHNIAESVLSDVMPTIDGKNIHLSCLCEDAMWANWIGDPIRIKQIVINLVSNAIKFTEKGTVSVKFNDSKTKEQAGIYLEVNDTGIGIDKENHSSIFTKFSQVDSSSTRNKGGSGLGLAITQSLVKRLSGTIVLKSELGFGTNIKVFIPLIKSTAQETKQKINYKNKSPELEGRKVLIVDDTAINRVIIKKALLPTNAIIIEAENGHEAVKKCEENNPDIVFMDIQMPVMDGVDAYRLMKRKGMHCPVIAFTANVLKHDVERYFREGFHGYLSKPINIGDFYRTLIQFI